MTNLHEGFDPEHFDEKTQVDVTSPRGTKYSDVAITYTATIVDGKPVVHPRSIVASRTDTPVAFTKQMTEIVLQDQQALAAIQQHADQAWSERDNSEQGDNIAALMPKITARREELMNQGVEPEEALEQAAEELGVDPERVMDEFDLRNESAELSRVKELAGLSESVITPGVWNKISQLKQQYMQQGMEPEEAQEEAAVKLGVDPEALADWLEDDQSWEDPSEIDQDLAYRISHRAGELQKKYRMSDAEANEEAAQELGIDPEEWNEWRSNNVDNYADMSDEPTGDPRRQYESDELSRVKDLAGLK